uniref:Uncharacterized protein n=1 Tax=Eucampia antarctica TaxID=49252 RepID=A0A7S2VZZ4_9STRA|mmetsp:Transcript_14633/g.14112  ORF Transcript_14633/g.14112 Transcript_14633/m.14112 type:complete len:242 (+) Transcript_14633:3-728(+)
MIEGSSAFVTQNRRFISTTNKGLFQSADALSKSPNDEDNATSSIRFLGKGSNAIVRPGVILVAPKHEYDHFLMKSAVFIFAIGLNDYDESVVRGVIVDHPTAFTMGEMSSGAVYGSLAHNILFRGGDSGNDSAMLLHCRGGDIISSGNGEIGDSGIYEGGMQESMDTVDDDKEGVTVDDFKFFFNYMEFTEKELENMLLEEDSEGDAWISMEVSPEVILNSDYNRGSAWSYLRNQAKRRQL